MIDKACSKLGACGAGYGWIRCASNVKPCGECGGGVGAPGYMCSAKVDYLCMPCVMKGAAAENRAAGGGGGGTT